MNKYTAKYISLFLDKIKYPEFIGTDECWEWQRATHGRGYGTVWMNGKVELAHRVMYSIAVGNILDGLFVLHTCDNPRCCNPAHLWLGTNDDNMKDMVKKGRSAKHAGVDNGREKLTENDVTEIRRYYATGVMTRVELQKKYNVSKSLIGQILIGNIWKHLP